MSEYSTNAIVELNNVLPYVGWLAKAKRAVEGGVTAITKLETALAQATSALEIIAGERQAADNLMSDKDIARETLRLLRERS